MTMGSSEQVLVATLGTEPQVITIALDYLIQTSHPIRETIVIYTDSPNLSSGLTVLEKEFNTPQYAQIKLNLVPVTGRCGPVEDFSCAEDVDALLRTFYRVIHGVKEHNGLVHLSISGGRKVMGTIGMVAAQFLFGPQDHAWYLFTRGWKPGDSRNMHYDAEMHSLIEVPVLRWDDSSLILGLSDFGNPVDLLHWQESASRLRRIKRSREFVEHWLTGAEHQVVALACQGLDNDHIAAQLKKSIRTVANQLTTVYSKLDEWLDFPESKVDRTTLLTELAPFFMLRRESKRGSD